MGHPIIEHCSEQEEDLRCTRRSRGADRSHASQPPRQRRGVTSIRTATTTAAVIVCVAQFLLIFVFWMEPNFGQAFIDRPYSTRRRRMLSAVLPETRTMMTESSSSHRSPSVLRRDNQDVFSRQDEIGHRQSTQAETRQSTTSNNNLCQLNDQGLYTTNPDELTSGSNEFTEVNYNYQTSVVAGTSLSTINNVVIPDVDRAITTAILPSLFPAACGSNNQRRQIQGADVTLVAISDRRADEVVNGQSCVVIVPYSTCYVSRGSAIVVFRGMSIEEVNQMVKDAVQMALQSGNIASSVSSGLVLDVSAISDSLQSLPPVGQTQTSTPVVVPSPTTLPPQSRPPLPSPTVKPVTDPPVISTNAPIPYSRLTSAPFASPVDPGSSGAIPTKAPTMQFTGSPIIIPANSLPPIYPSTTRPTKGQVTASPSGTIQSGEPTTSSAQNTQSPATTSSSKEEDQSREGDEKKMEWWAWLLISISGACVLFCLCTAVARRLEADQHFSSSGLKNSSHLGGNETDDDNHDGVEYEPPPNSTFASESPSNDNAADAFFNNAAKDDDEDDDDYESYINAEDVDEELDYADEDEVNEEESEVQRNGVVDQESYYDDEDIDEASEVSEGGWRNQQSHSRY